MSQPWKSAGAPSSQFSMADYVGELLLFVFGGVHETFKISDNTVPAARCNIVVLSGPQAGREWTDALIFAVIALDQFRAEAPGNVLLGRVRARRGGNNRDMYYIDNEVTPYDDQTCGGWNAAYPGKLAHLQAQVMAQYQAEELKLGGPPVQTQQAASPPPPPPPPPAPPVTQGAAVPPAAAPPWAPQTPAPAPAAVAPEAAPPPWAPAGSADTPPY